jgi:hypothetical protein
MPLFLSRPLALAFAPIAGLLFVTLAAAATFQNEPDGHGPARFGMSVERIRELLPGMQELAVEKGEPWTLYIVEGQSFDELKACKMTLGFFADELYETKFDCGADEKVKAALYGRFGRPSVIEERMAIWRGDRAVVSMNRSVKTFAIADAVRIQRLHMYIFQKALLRGSKGGGKTGEGEAANMPESP